MNVYFKIAKEMSFYDYFAKNDVKVSKQRRIVAVKLSPERKQSQDTVNISLV